MQRSLDDNLNRLVLSLAKIIEFIKVNGLINDSNSRRFKTIEENYLALSREKIDVLKYDFHPIKRAINAFIHPDIADAKIKEKGTPLASQFNGILNDIEKEQKNLQTSYYWNYKIRAKTENVKTEPEEEKSCDSTEPFLETIKDLWNLLVHKIPRDANDYFKLKSNYKHLIEKLEEKIANKEKILAELSENLTSLEAKWKKEKSSHAVDMVYRSELSHIKHEYEKAQLDKRSITATVSRVRDHIMRTSWQEIETKIRDMHLSMIEMNKTYKELSSLDSSYDKMKYRDTKYTCAQMRAQIEAKFKKFPNIDAVRNYVINKVVSNDQRYQVEVNRLDEVNEKIDSLAKDIDYYYSHPGQIRKEIVSEIDDKFKKRRDEIVRRERLVSSKNEKMKEKVIVTKNKYAAFLGRYQSVYERRNEKEKSK